jgi:hypothetical protein
MIVVPFITLKGRSLLARSYPPGYISKLASELSEKFERVYVADLDGIQKNKPQLDVVQEMCDEIPTVYEGGVRFASNIIDMLITGADRAVVGTSTLASLEDLRGAFKLSENIIFKVDYRDGIVSFDQAIAERGFLALARDVTDIGIREIVVPGSLANEAAKAKKELGVSLGVFASLEERSAMEQLGADYIVSEDYGSLIGHE